MKFIIFACLVAVALAAPQVDERFRTSATLREENVNEGNGVFRYGYETDTGITVDAAGAPGVEGQSNIGGSFRFPFGDGTYLEVTYEADENGYRPVSRFVRE